MAFVFKRAVREKTPVILATAGGTQSGKTYSLLRVATGIVAKTGGKIRMIDTENGRGSHYAAEFEYDYTRLSAPYSPARYLEAIKDAEKIDDGKDVLIIDSASHEWNGVGGCQDMHDDAVERMAKGDEAKAERVSVLAWKKPKQEHRAFMNHIAQSKTHMLFGLRAEHKLEVAKTVDDKGKEHSEFLPPKWLPICEKHFMFEMLAACTLDPKSPGVPIPIKIEGQHKFAFPAGEKLSEDTGKRLLAWCSAGGTDPNKQPAVFVLFKATGAEIGRYPRAMQYLEMLHLSVKELDKPADVVALFDKNMDVFYSVQDIAKRKKIDDALALCNKIGRLVNEKSTGGK